MVMWGCCIEALGALSKRLVWNSFVASNMMALGLATETMGRGVLD